MLVDCKLLELPKIADPRGNLTFVENQTHIPFNIKRVYYTYDVPGGAEREADTLTKSLNNLLLRCPAVSILRWTTVLKNRNFILTARILAYTFVL